MSKQEIDAFLNFRLLLEPAAAGASDLQKEYRTALKAIAVLVSAGAADRVRERR